MRLGSLFSGAGLGDLGWMMAGFDIRWQVEIEDYCQKVLDLRFPESKKYHDIKEFKGTEVDPVDIVVGGFPCQPFSVAGKQEGDQDDRNLWPDMFRVIKEVRPTWVVGENVSGIIPIYLDTILADLESEGYACRTFVFSAHSLGANHRRERIWVVGYSPRKRFQNRRRTSMADSGEKESELKRSGGQQTKLQESLSDTSNTGIKRMCERKKSTNKDVANARCVRQKKHEKQTTRIEQRSKTTSSYPKGKRQSRRNMQAYSGDESTSEQEQHNSRSEVEQYLRFWSFEPGMGRVADGVPKRMDRLKALGNGQVVGCTAFIGQQIMEFEKINDNLG